MEIIAMVSTTSPQKSFQDMASNLVALGYSVTLKDNKSFFINANLTLDKLKTALKAAKDSVKFNGSIKITYGTSSSTL